MEQPQYFRRSGPTRYVVADGETIDVPMSESTMASTVWHYTTAAGLQGIIESRSLWASSTLSLNDSSEMQYGLGILTHAWHRKDKTAIPEAVIEVIDLIFSSGSAGRLASEMFLVSTSKDVDSLNQWQGYAGAQGYAIELIPHMGWAYLANEDTPREPNALDLPTWLDVIYDGLDQDTKADEVLDFGVVLLTPDPKNPRHDVPFLLAQTAIRMKHSGFTNEREVRLVVRKRDDQRERFRTGPRGLIPYVSLVSVSDTGAWIYAKDASELLPISSVMCGPVAEPDKAQVVDAVERLLRANGYASSGNFTPPVRTSQIPYRF